MRRVIALIAVVVMVWIVLRRESSVGSTSAVTPASATEPALTPTATPTSTPTSTSGASGSSAQTSARNNDAARAPSTNFVKGFRDKAHFDEHFAKHGGEFAGLSKAQYLAAAQTLRDARAGGDVLEIVRASDGVVSRFDKRSGAFLAFDRDGTIRTFFKPNDGEKYFRRQANRAPSP